MSNANCTLVLIIIIIIIVVLIYKFVIQTPAKTKRWLDDAPLLALRSVPAAARDNLVPGLEWAGNQLKPRDPDARRAFQFVA